MITNIALSYKVLGLHFTGSTTIFRQLWKKIGENYHTRLPRIVGETGGKDFIFCHPTADLEVSATAIIEAVWYKVKNVQLHLEYIYLNLFPKNSFQIFVIR